MGSTASMPLFVLSPGHLLDVTRTTFAAEHLKEREHLQALLRQRISVVAQDVLVVAEEFGEFADANRRIDLLGLDRIGRLVVIELKRTEDGGHMELQALRYAAMVRTMTFARLCEVYDKHLVLHPDSSDDDARTRLGDWLDDGSAEVLATDVRIVLVSADFGKEITGTVLWLNEYGLDIRCVRTTPYRLGEQVLLDVQQVIPLPEATDYQVQIRQKQALEKATAATNHDLTKFTVTDAAGHTTEPLPKRRAALAMVKAVIAAGVHPETLTSVLADSRYKAVPGLHDPSSLPGAFASAHPKAEGERWWLTDPLPGQADTYVLTKMWGLKTATTLQQLAALVPGGAVSFTAAEG